LLWSQAHAACLYPYPDKSIQPTPSSYFLGMRVNLLQPTGYVMYQQVYHSKTLSPGHTVFMFCIYLETNRNLCHLQHKLIGFYNRDEKCLLRGTDYIFK
jgi:hypothetical protein